MKYVLVDTANTFFRARHAISRQADAFTKVGFSLHVLLSSINKVVKKMNADHVVFMLEGRSWRKDVYAPYKANRTVANLKKTEPELEEDKLFWEVYDEFTKYIQDKTNCTVLRHPQAEADDLIGRWIVLHPEDNHVILSSDSDFVQLLTDRVVQYNGITNHTISLNGVQNDKGQTLEFTVKSDSKLKIGKPNEDFMPNDDWNRWALFLKLMRGDSGDNVFSAFPGVRIKGTKNKTGLTEAFADMHSQGFAWNNLMLQRWVDHNKEEHRVLDDYHRNEMLIDLTKQPEELKEAFDRHIIETVNQKHIPQVGIKFLKFCGKHELNKLTESAEQYSRWLNRAYTGNLLT